MSFSEVAPSTAVLNGGSDTPRTEAPKTAMPKQSTTTQKAQTTTEKETQTKAQTQAKPEPTPKTKPKKVETTSEPVSYHSKEEPEVTLWGELGFPLIVVLLIFAAFLRLVIKWSAKHPKVGYAHRHARAGGHSHNTPGKMLPRLSGHGGHRKRRH